MDNTVGSLTEFERSIIIGSVLGDGYLRTIPGRKNAFLEIDDIELWFLGPFESEDFKKECENNKTVPNLESTCTRYKIKSIVFLNVLFTYVLLKMFF